MSLLNSILKMVGAAAPPQGWRLPPPYSTVADDQAAAMAQVAQRGPQTWDEQTPVSVKPIDVPQQPGEQVSAAPQKRHGVLGALGSVFAPDPGSFWHSALANGLWDAKGGQQRYKAGSYDYGHDATAAKIDDAKLRSLLDTEKNGDIVTSPTGQVLRTKSDGSVEVLWTPPAPKSREEKLIDMWHREQDPTVKEWIARAIPGYQYSPEYMNYKTQNAITVKKTVPGKAPSAGKTGIPALPPGFRVVQ